MPRNPKTEMLRVRLTVAERDAMEQLIVNRGKGETISRFIRDVVIGSYISRDGREPYMVNSDIHRKLEKLGELLNRDPDRVAEECIEGICHMIENEKEDPLIVQEVKLRQRYTKPEKNGKTTRKPKS